jgi:predicted MFS family arabinose efflux permease/quinol monooxygenase YgiN
MTDSVQTEAATPGAWAPLRHRIFRMLWIAQVFSLVGTWAQTVGAQWFLTVESGRPELVALVQTATSLPVLLLAIPAGALADVLDRRRMLIIVQTGMALVAVGLAVDTLTGHLGTMTLLAFTAALGAGVALTNPAFQATVPELVPRAELPAAAALNGVAVNLARAIGPAIGGLVVAVAGVGWTFAFNAVSYLVFVVALLRLPRTPPRMDPEPFTNAMRLAVGYVRASPAMLQVLARTALWVLPASALWALLPVVANSRLKLDSTGYGLLLAALGVGAILGAWQLGRIRTRLSTTSLLVLAAAGYALALVVLAVGRSTPIALVVLVLAGAGWTGVLATLNAISQLILPGWVRARALAVYLLVFQGGQALGSLVWGAVAGWVSTEVSLLAAAAVLLLGLATLPILRLPDPNRHDPSPSTHWPTPELALEPDQQSGAVLVTVEYRVLPDCVDDFLSAMAYASRSRLRTGALRWGLYRDGAETNRFLELYLVPSWREHVRQHEHRQTVTDRNREEALAKLLVEPPQAGHLFSQQAPSS